MKNYIYILFAILSISAFSCTDLEVEEIDSEVVDQDFSNVNVESRLDGLYNSFGGFMIYQDNTYALMEVTADAQLIPTRGTDWGDGGVWRQLHQHTWTSRHPQILNSWNGLNGLTFGANQILLSNPDPQQEAEARFIRALARIMILDLWGKVPDRDPSLPVDSNPIVYERGEEAEHTIAELIGLIEEDLADTHINNLPSTGPGAAAEDLRRASKAAALHLRAKFYLNKHILLNGAGNNSAANPSPESADLQQVVEDVDQISAEGYSLQSDYFGIFESPHTSTESIYLITGGDGANPRIANTLHYNHNFVLNGGGWNGFATTSEFYSLFEGPEDTNAPESGQEIRRGYVPNDDLGRGMLYGQQYDNNGNALETRGGAPLFFTREMPEELTGHGEATGIRLIKYPPLYNEDGGPGGGPANQIFFRYADAVLMKAEALFRIGNSGEALNIINNLRDLRGATPLASLSEDDIIDERGRELYIEFWRRQDLIRFGKFLEPWLYKPQSEDYRLLFPIPITAVSTNPNLTQNDGYQGE
ncbi:MAG: RagB/SusD family nutrient uptake outer membrane protein [Bacteroidetes bacterium]|nr:MAG: RagB/SusD family nutrient uptake outer membrane protein [Bacteroidota bacterium]